MSVAMTLNLSERATEFIRARAAERRRDVDEVVEEVLEEIRRASEFPGIVFVDRPGGGRKSKIDGGMDVWEYVFIAAGYDWDPARTAEHLCQPERNVQIALEYYRAYPDEVDERLRRMDEFDRDPQSFCPRIRAVQV